MAEKFRGYRKISTGEFLKVLHGTDGDDWGISEARALSSVSSGYGVDVSDLEAVTGASDMRTGTLIQPLPEPWGDTERRTRNGKLSDTDWTQGADSTMDADKKAEWATYRQALRDLPATQPNIIGLIWPTEPS